MKSDAIEARANEPTAEGAQQGREFRRASLLWGAFIILLALFNGTIPFALGADLHGWTQSPLKSVLFGLIFYGVLFLAIPLLLIKGRDTVRQPAFLIPLCVAIAAITLWRFFPFGVAVVIVVLLYLHRRYDLSGYGIRSRGWRGDMAAVALMGALGLIPVLMRGPLAGASLPAALSAAITRLFANPASTVENLFYFGFLTERLSYRAGRWLTPLLVGLMYTAHEMTNPEYWYGGMAFGLVFFGVAIWAAVYLWRRSAVVIWLGDGLYRFVMALV